MFKILQKITERVHDHTGIGPAGQSAWISVFAIFLVLNQLFVQRIDNFPFSNFIIIFSIPINFIIFKIIVYIASKDDPFLLQMSNSAFLYFIVMSNQQLNLMCNSAEYGTTLLLISALCFFVKKGFAKEKTDQKMISKGNMDATSVLFDEYYLSWCYFSCVTIFLVFFSIPLVLMHSKTNYTVEEILKLSTSIIVFLSTCVAFCIPKPPKTKQQHQIDTDKQLVLQ